MGRVGNGIYYELIKQRGWHEESSARIKSQLERSAPIVQNPCIILLGAIGDGICLLNALKSLKKQRPDVKITLVCEPPLCEFMHAPFIERVVEFPSIEAEKESVEMLVNDIETTCDSVINLHSTIRSAAFTSFFHKIPSYGLMLDSDGEPCIKGNLWTIFFHRVFYPHFIKDDYAAQNILGRTAMLCYCLGVDPSAMLDAGDFPFLNCKINTSLEKQGKHIVICPDANAPSRRWPKDHFERLIELFSAEGGVSISIAAAKQIVDANERARDMQGKTDIRGLFELISGADLLISNDTGTIHIAGALGIDTLTICGPNNVGPEAKGRHLTVRKAVPCGPCSKTECDSLECMKRLAPEEIFDIARAMLAGPDLCAIRDIADKKEIVAGYSFETPLSPFFDYWPLALPLKGIGPVKDGIERWLMVYVFNQESGIDSFSMEDLVGFMRTRYELEKYNHDIILWIDDMKRSIENTIKSTAALSDRLKAVASNNAAKARLMQTPGFFESIRGFIEKLPSLFYMPYDMGNDLGHIYKVVSLINNRLLTYKSALTDFKDTLLEKGL